MVGRFAPSPTGRMHLGNVWVALLNYLEIRAAGGTLILRLEDLDPARCRPAFSEQLLADLAWLGLDYDRGGAADDLFRQSNREDIYQAVLDRFASENLVYPCFCSRADLQAVSAPHPEDGHRIYPGTCRLAGQAEKRPQPGGRIAAWRLHVSDQLIAFTDVFCGPQQLNLAREWGDFVIRRGDGSFAYQLACAADDALMGVDFVLRGRDLLRSTFPQQYIFQLLGRPVPVYAHVPLLVDETGCRLSKRQQSLDLGALQAAGFSAEAILGYLAWLAGLTNRQEPVTARELVSHYRRGRLAASPEITVPTGRPQRIAPRNSQ